jgi:hypothetical protein
MNRIFSISNKKNNGLWFAARDVNEAIKLAIALGHVRNPANAHTSDITDKLLGRPGVKEIIDSENQGHCYCQGEALTIDEIMAGHKSKPWVWKMSIINR